MRKTVSNINDQAIFRFWWPNPKFGGAPSGIPEDSEGSECRGFDGQCQRVLSREGCVGDSAQGFGEAVLRIRSMD